MLVLRCVVVSSRGLAAVLHNKDRELDCESATHKGKPEYVLSPLVCVVDTLINADSLLVLYL
jgi:hypothetical protein